MRDRAADKIIELMEHRGVPCDVIDHPPCRTSRESARARAAAGGGAACGAKAIVVKMDWEEGVSDFNVLVLPSPARIDSKALLRQVPALRKFRFATPQELAAQTGGLEPGMMPPFARPIFEGLLRLYIDTGLLGHDLIGFNLGTLTRSLIVPCARYVDLASPTAILSFAVPSQGE